MKWLIVFFIMSCSGSDQTHSESEAHRELLLEDRGDLKFTLVYSNNLDGEIEPCG